MNLLTYIVKFELLCPNDQPILILKGMLEDL